MTRRRGLLGALLAALAAWVGRHGTGAGASWEDYAGSVSPVSAAELRETQTRIVSMLEQRPVVVEAEAPGFCVLPAGSWEVLPIAAPDAWVPLVDLGSIRVDEVLGLRLRVGMLPPAGRA